jgi:hypothetical protein
VKLILVGFYKLRLRDIYRWQTLRNKLLYFYVTRFVFFKICSSSNKPWATGLAMDMDNIPWLRAMHGHISSRLINYVARIRQEGAISRYRIRHRYGLDTYHPSILFLFYLGNIEYMTWYVSAYGRRPSPTSAPLSSLSRAPLEYAHDWKNIGIEKM